MAMQMMAKVAIPEDVRLADHEASVVGGQAQEASVSA
jgi:hypothetical protein